MYLVENLIFLIEKLAKVALESYILKIEIYKISSEVLPRSALRCPKKSRYFDVEMFKTKYEPKFCDLI